MHVYKYVYLFQAELVYHQEEDRELELISYSGDDKPFIGVVTLVKSGFLATCFTGGTHHFSWHVCDLHLRHSVSFSFPMFLMSSMQDCAWECTCSCFAHSKGILDTPNRSIHHAIAFEFALAYNYTLFLQPHPPECFVLPRHPCIVERFAPRTGGLSGAKDADANG